MFRDCYDITEGARGRHAFAFIAAIEELRQQNGRRFGREPNPHASHISRALPNAPARIDNSV